MILSQQSFPSSSPTDFIINAKYHPLQLSHTCLPVEGMRCINFEYAEVEPATRNNTRKTHHSGYKRCNCSEAGFESCSANDEHIFNSTADMWEIRDSESRRPESAFHHSIAMSSKRGGVVKAKLAVIPIKRSIQLSSVERPKEKLEQQVTDLQE